MSKIKDTQKRIAEWCPTLPYHAFRFDLTTLSGGRNRAVDGRKVIGTGALNRFATDLTKLTTTKDWKILNQLIAMRCRELATVDEGRYQITLPEVSRGGNLVAVEINLARGSDLAFADRTLTSITACEIKRSKPNWLVRLFHMLLGHRNAA